MTLLAALLAHAADLPARPPPPAPVEGECVAEVPVRIGERPSFVGADGRATCRGILVGTSTYADLLASQDDAELVRALYRVEVAALTEDVAAEHERAAYWQALAERPAVAPVVYVGAGVVAGVALTVASAYVVNLAADAP